MADHTFQVDDITGEYFYLLTCDGVYIKQVMFFGEEGSIECPECRMRVVARQDKDDKWSVLQYHENEEG